MKTRDQAIIAAISDQDSLLGQAAEARYVVSLPGMLLRHGLLQTLAFLQRKAAANDDKEDTGNRALLKLLALGVNAASGVQETKLGDADALRRLATLPLTSYLHIQETAVMVATWIKRLHEAREADREARAKAGAA